MAAHTDTLTVNAIRAQFPALSRTEQGTPVAYFSSPVGLRPDHLPSRQSALFGL